MIGLGFTKSPDGSSLPSIRMSHSDVFLNVSFSSTGVVQLNLTDQNGTPTSCMLLGGDSVLTFVDFKKDPTRGKTLENMIEECVAKML